MTHDFGRVGARDDKLQVVVEEIIGVGGTEAQRARQPNRESGQSIEVIASFHVKSIHFRIN